MTVDSSATPNSALVLPGARAGLWWGLLGVVGFSLTVPLTRVAVGTGAMSPLFVGCGRAVVAALLAGAALAVTGQLRPESLPRGRQWARIAVVAGGVVVGFPVLTSFALTTAPASHGAVVIAVLPAATAVAAVLRGRERPPVSFWVLAAVGALLAVAFGALQGGGLGGLQRTDLLLFGAVVAGAVGYAEGGLLARELGAWQTLSWALLLVAPLMIVLTGVSVAEQLPGGGPAEWAAFAYVSLVSMFGAMVVWYRGLAIGPMAQVSQVQLVQPVLTISWAALLLHETLTWPTVLGGLAVVVCAATAVRSRSGERSRGRSVRGGPGERAVRVSGPG